MTHSDHFIFFNTLWALRIFFLQLASCLSRRSIAAKSALSMPHSLPFAAKTVQKICLFGKIIVILHPLPAKGGSRVNIIYIY